MQRNREVQGRGISPSGPDRSQVDFDAKIVMHLVYGNEASAAVAKHKQHGYATASVTDARWFESKERFMGAVCNAFEQFWEEMNVDKPRSDVNESEKLGS